MFSVSHKWYIWIWIWIWYNTFVSRFVWIQLKYCANVFVIFYPSNYVIFYISHYIIFYLNHYVIFYLSDYVIFNLSDYVIFHLSHYAIFHLSHYVIFHLSHYVIFDLSDYATCYLMVFVIFSLRIRYNVSEWSDMSIHRLMFHSASTMYIWIQLIVLV